MTLRGGRTALIVVSFFLLTSCGHSPAVESLSALEQASVAFNGNPSPSTIKAKLDQALRLYDTPISEENYSRAASTLVALRKQNGTGEMLILDHMIRSHVDGVNISFPEMAAISSVALTVGDR